MSLTGFMVPVGPALDVRLEATASNGTLADGESCEVDDTTPICGFTLARANAYEFRVPDPHGVLPAATVRIEVPQSTERVDVLAVFDMYSMEGYAVRWIRVDVPMSVPLAGIDITGQDADLALHNTTAETLYWGGAFRFDYLDGANGWQPIHVSLGGCGNGAELPILGESVAPGGRLPMHLDAITRSLRGNQSTAPPYRIRTEISRVRTVGTIVRTGMPEIFVVDVHEVASSELPSLRYWVRELP